MHSSDVNTRVGQLAKLFSKFRIYPSVCYVENSPARIFQRMFPEDHYSRDLETFLQFQDYAPEQRGADLPWWGKDFFTQRKGFRTLMVAQDSLSKDAGSVVLYAPLMPIIDSKVEYKKYADQLSTRGFFFNSWRTVREQLVEWNIDFDFLYMTDAKKVYKKGSWKSMDFDRAQSKELLESEIALCNPDLIILLGASPLNLLQDDKKFSTVFEERGSILIQGKRCVVTPFLTGNGRTQRDFKKRLDVATGLIKKERSSRPIQS